jgi:tetratricopeptide (TPR) repeat protein
LLVAERQLAKVAELGIDSQRLQRYQEVLNQKIASAVSVLVIKANTAYTLGEIESAIVDWQQALALQPNNAVVVEKLARAKAFKNYYESLQLERLSSD